MGKDANASIKKKRKTNNETSDQEIDIHKVILPNL